MKIDPSAIEAAAKELYTQLVRARLREATDPAASAAANAAVEEFWMKEAVAVTALEKLRASWGGYVRGYEQRPDLVALRKASDLED